MTTDDSSDPQREFDEHMAEIHWTNVAIADIAKQEAFLAGVRQVWRDNRNEERDRLQESGRVDESAFLKFTAQEISAVLAQYGGDA